MKSDAIWYFSCIGASIFLGLCLAIYVNDQVKQYNRVNTIVTCLESKDTDLTFCKNLANSIVK
jgi:hypothetical protein